MTRAAPIPCRNLLAPARAVALAAVCLAVAGCPARVAHPPVELQAHAEPDVVGATHVVQPGETLWRISRRYGVSVEALAAANGLGEGATKLSVGQELRIPEPPTAEPQGPGRSGEPASKAATVARLDWPLVGVLYARFGPRGETRHDGIDIAVPEGTVVRAAAAGTVLFSAEQRGYGYLVILEHAQGLLTLYAHNRRNLVEEGARVKAGAPIAEVGPGGRTSGPHVHFEVREKGLPQDPMKYLPPPR